MVVEVEVEVVDGVAEGEEEEDQSQPIVELRRAGEIRLGWVRFWSVDCGAQKCFGCELLKLFALLL